MIYAWCVLKGNYRAAKIWGLCGFPIAVSVHGYTGFILALAKGRAFWNTPLNPILFLVSAMVSGLALIILILNLRKRYLLQDQALKDADTRIIQSLLSMMYIFLIVEIFLMGCDVAVLAHSRVDEYEMYYLLTQGKWAPLFLGVELILGGLVPLLLLSVKRIRVQSLGQCAACALILCGIFVMRVIIVVGGQSVRLH